MDKDDRFELTPPSDPSGQINRREFVQRLALATAGVGFFAAAFKGVRLTPDQQDELSEAFAQKMGAMKAAPFGTRMKDKLGTVKVTPIVMAQDWPRELYGPAIAAGIRYVHKAGYWRSLPDEFKKLKREEFFTDITVDTTPNNPDDEEGAYRQVIESLDRTGLRYHDVFKAHFGWKTVDDLKKLRGTYRAFLRLKKEGKVRFFGASQHEYVPYPEIIAAEIADGTIDTLQVFFSYGYPKATIDIFDKAHQAGIGMMAMKVWNSGNGAMRNDPAMQAKMKAQGQIGKALYRYVTTLQGSDKKPIFDCCVSNIRNMAEFEENVGAALPKVAAADGFDYFA